MFIYSLFFFYRNIYLNGRNLAIGDLGHTKALNNNSSNNSNRTFGTNNYLAPESFEPKNRSEKMDIW